MSLQTRTATTAVCLPAKKTICNTPKTTDDIISEIFRTFGLTMTIEQYVLVGSTVRSYLSWMKDRGVVDFTINSALLWRDAELS